MVSVFIVCSFHRCRKSERSMEKVKAGYIYKIMEKSET